MTKSIRIRFIVLGLLIIGALFCILPTLFPDLSVSWHKLLPSQGMRMGLDLQGGMHLILKVDIDQAAQNHFDISMADLQTTLRKEQIEVAGMESIGPLHQRLRLSSIEAAQTVKEILKDDYPGLEALAEGNGYLEIGLKQKEREQIQDSAVDQSLEVIRNRIDLFGVEEPVIVRQGRDEIVLQLAGIKEPQRAMEIVGRTAQLEFKLVDSRPMPDLDGLVEKALLDGKLKPGYTHQDLNQALQHDIPIGCEVYIEKSSDPQTGVTTRHPLLLKKNALMTGEAVKSARVEINNQLGEPQVGLILTPRGARQFETITQENVGRQLAIILDDIVQSAPVIQEPISGGKAQITGRFTSEQAHDLAIVLRAGALPAPLQIVQNLTVGPSLGRDSIEKGLASTLLGALLVAFFMVIYYRLSGVIANWALLLNLILMVAVLSLFGATLTLPGIAGIVLSIGMAVDSNVLIFERMREELALKKTVYACIQGGYDKALWTIVDSHVTTLITAAALFLFGTGPIKGFAVTLSIGVVLNLFTALYGTRVIYDYLHLIRRLKSFRFLSILKKTSIDFIRLRNGAFVLSAVLVGLGLYAGLGIVQGKANLGVDFAGGAMIQLKAAKPFRLDGIRTVLNHSGLTHYELQEVPSEKTLLVRVKSSDLQVGSIADKVSGALQQNLPQNRFSLQSKAEIGASVSRDLKRAALIAIAISLVGIIAYLGWRFDLRFGVAAAMATFHDVLTVLGIFYLLNKEITLLVVTALLTLAGYSLTDTVVVFDRIRETQGKGKRRDLGEVINQSVNEVLSRTIITSGTVFMVLAALLVMGGVLLRDFALALLIGVVVGTYSSVFVASPIVYLWERSAKRSAPPPSTNKRRK
jgi:SecD/SecF fusion protein